MIRKIEKIFLLSVFILIGVCAWAQDGTYGAYSPYSIFGMGELSKQGTAFNKSMGGVGIATRNKRFINYVNPAAVTARDSLSFMADFGLVQKNTLYKQRNAWKNTPDEPENAWSANNTFNIYDFMMSFPLWKSSAFMVGITPFSDVGYDFSHIEKEEEIIGQTGNITYDSYGNGSVYQLFIGAGATFWKSLSIGAEAIYYFGNIDKATNMIYSDASYRSINSGSELSIRGFTGKFGLQYEQKLGGNMSMVLGATYRLGADMKGYSVNYRYAIQSSVSDSLRYSVDTLGIEKLRVADEIGVGLAVKYGDKWSAEFNYSRSDWSNTGVDNAAGFEVKGDMSFTATVSQSFRAGFEIVPNRNDIRYYARRCAYRAGAYFDQEYYKVNGHGVNTYGLTFGVTLPVFRWYNGLSLGVDMGQRASTRNNMIREQYITFNVGFNIHDIWFQKPRYN